MQPAEFKKPRDLLVSRQDIAHEKSAPAAAILRWWQALQFQDARTAARFYVRKTSRSDVEALARELASFLTSSRPDITETQVSGSGKAARVLASVQWVAFTPSGARVVELPATFYLQRADNGGWKLTDNSFLDYRLKLQRGTATTRGK